MRGLLLKIVHEVWLMTLLVGTGLLAVNVLLTYILPQIQAGMGSVFQRLPWVRSMLTALLGTEIGSTISAQTMQAFLWVHPTVLALVWAHEMVICTRFPAGEIDRGTVDILLGWPVSRRLIYLAEIVTWLLTGLIILLMGLVGHRLAAPAMPPAMRPEFARALVVIANLYCVYFAVGGIAFLISAVSDRRGRAMGAVFAVVLFSFLLNFLAQFWEPARQIAFLGVMQYYQPARVLVDGTIPWRDMAVLLGVGLAGLLAGGEVVARRSLLTV